MERMAAGWSRWLAGRSVWQLTLLVAAGTLLLYVPFAGSYGLWDPWETHYSEVARQMTKRADFISLWWPGSPRDPEVFWSKPVLTFWLLSLGMHLFGVGLRGGPAGEMALSHRVEWAVRLPMCALGAVAVAAVFYLAARFINRRAGLLAAVALATMPMFSLIARQAMTDMPFVAAMAVALCLGALALLDAEVLTGDLPRRGRSRGTAGEPRGWASWPHDVTFYATVALLLVTVLPQLIIDSVALRVGFTLAGHRLVVAGVVVMLPYYAGLLVVIAFAARARRRGPLRLIMAGVMCGLAVLAKGFAGLALPVIVFVAYLAFTWSWWRLRRPQLLLAVAVAFLACVVVAAPWHHAMIIRHGWAFWNELFGDNHWRRLMIGRHGDNNGLFDYFLREAGFGTWPWVALAPAALISAALVRVRADTAEAAGPKPREAAWLGAIWFVTAYTVVSLSMTKFHHYVLPALPGLAITVGWFADELLAAQGARRARLAVLAGAPLLLVIAGDWLKSVNAAQRFLWLFSYDYIHSPTGRPWPPELDFRAALTGFLVLFLAGLVALLVRRARRAGVAVFAAGAVVFTFFLLDVYMVRVAPFWSQKELIATYYKQRRSPEERLVAYQMYWRGETFYTSNEIFEGPLDDRTVFDMDAADEKLQAWIASHRGRRVFFLFERLRQQHLVGLLPAESRASFTVDDQRNNKFSVAHADL